MNPLVVGDVHINAKLNVNFERERIEALTASLKGQQDYSTIVFAGDTFDSDTPNLEEIDIFYTMIRALEESYKIFVFGGNHDPTVFNYLPETGFTYLTEPTKLGAHFLCVPWNCLPSFIQSRPSNPDVILISHARCTIPPHIVEEVDISYLSKHFKLTVLGDIHYDYQPYKNVIYTTSPSNVVFNTTLGSKAFRGYIGLRGGSFKYERIQTKLPTKWVVEFDSVKEARAFILENQAARDYYKIFITDLAENLPELHGITGSRIIKVVLPKIEEVQSDSLSDSIKQFIDASISTKEYVYEYLQEVMKVKESILLEIKNRLNRLT